MVQAKGCGLAMWRQSAADVAAELDKKLHDKEWLAQGLESLQGCWQKNTLIAMCLRTN